jgi:hypothetical protein
MLKNFRYIVIFLVCLPAIGLFGSSETSFAQAGTNRAGVVVQFPGGDTRTYCVEFEGESSTGLELLMKTGLDVKVEVQGLGAMICSIGATGCDYPAQTCVCQSYGPDGVYWAYHHLQDGRWRTSITGASTYKVKAGSVEGWAWGPGGPPPVYTFEQICQVAVPPTNTPEPPALPTNTPEPTNTPAPEPTNTLLPPSSTPVVALAPTNTRQVQLTPTVTVEAEVPTQEPQVSVTDTPVPTAIPPTATDTAVPSATQTATEVPTITSQPTSTSTSTRVVSPSVTQTVVATSTPLAVTPTAGTENTARTLGLVIGGAVAGALVIWAAFAMVRRRTGPTDNGDSA